MCTQGRLNSIIGPGQNSALWPMPIQPLTGVKLQMSIELNINLLHRYFQQDACLNIKKHAVHNIHRLPWGPGQLPSVLMR